MPRSRPAPSPNPGGCAVTESAVTIAPVPFEEAITYFRRKADLPGQFSYKDVWGQEHTVAFTVAKAMQLDVLQDIRRAMDKAIASGTTFADFKKELTPLLQAKGWWGIQTMTDPKTGEVGPVLLGSPRRLATIFDTNMRAAYAAGHWQRIERLAESMPWLRYVHVACEHPRLAHLKLHGTVLPVDSPFWGTYYPPNGWHCHCRVQQYSNDDLAEHGYKPSKGPPDLGPPKQFHNDRTGKTITVPAGCDPSFATNPGHAVSRVAWARAWLTEKAATADPALARAVVAAWVRSPDFADFLAMPNGQVPVMMLSPEAARAIGARQSLVVLSDRSAAKNLDHHPDLTVEDYRKLPGMGEAPDLVIQDGDNTVVIVKRDGKLYWAMNKAPQFEPTPKAVNDPYNPRAAMNNPGSGYGTAEDLKVRIYGAVSGVLCQYTGQYYTASTPYDAFGPEDSDMEAILPTDYSEVTVAQNDHIDFTPTYSALEPTDGHPEGGPAIAMFWPGRTIVSFPWHP